MRLGAPLPSLLAAPLIGLIAALAMAARIAQLEEAFSPRALGVVALAGVGGLLAGIIAAPLAKRIGGRWPLPLRAVLAALGVGLGFLAATGLAFAVLIRSVEGYLDDDAVQEGRYVEIFFSHVGALGLYAVAGRRYVLPWPALVVGAAGSLLLARSRRAGVEGRAGVEAADAAVLGRGEPPPASIGPP